MLLELSHHVREKNILVERVLLYISRNMQPRHRATGQHDTLASLQDFDSSSFD